MKTFLLDHLPGCTPLMPCASCEAVSFLRSKLSEPDFNTLLEKIRATMPGEGSYGPSNPAPLEASIDILGLTTRAANSLKAEEIYKIGDLLKKTDLDIRKIPNIGHITFREIEGALERVGRHFGEVVPS